MTTKWFVAVERSVSAFTNTWCTRGPLLRERTVDLYRAWMEHGGVDSVSAVMFTRVLRTIPGLELEKSRGGYMVIGLKLKPHHVVAVSPEPPWEERDGI